MRPLIFVHGFRYDPSKSGEDNPHETIYKEWREHFPDREIVEFSYYSGGSGFEAVARAWAAGYRNSYRWAYGKLALDAAKRLIEEANALGECDVVCHSLGSRVVLEAANKGAPFKRVVILGGSEMVPIARSAAIMSPRIQYLNVMSRTDDIIDILAEHFTPGSYVSAIGHDGIQGVDNWKNAVLDDEEVQFWASENENWNLNGDLEGYWDHHVYYKHKENWALYKAFLDGNDLRDMPDKAVPANNDFFD